MAFTHDRQNRMVTLSDGTELQEWRVERLSDGTFEYHMYVGHNYSKPGEVIHSAGCVWMLFRIANAGGEDVIQETVYRMGKSGLPGSGNDLAETEWGLRATSTFFRFDEVLREFF